MKGSKRLLAMLLAVMMVVTALPMGAFAEEEPVVIDVPAEGTTVEPAEEPSKEEFVADEVQVELSGTENKLFFRGAGIDEDDKLFEDTTEELQDSLTVKYGGTLNGYFYYGTEANLEKVAYSELNIPGFITWKAPKAADRKDENDVTYLTGVRGQGFGVGLITYEDASMTVEVSLPGAGFFSVPEYSAEYYVGNDLPFTGERVDENGTAYEVYYYLKRSDDTVDAVTVLNFDGEQEPSVTAEIVDEQYAKITIKEGFDPEIGYDIMMCNSSGGEWAQGFSIVDEREAEDDDSGFSGTIGYYEEASGSADSSLGKGEGVVCGEVGVTVTAYLVWDPDTVGKLQNVLVSFRPSETGTLFTKAEIGSASDTLEEYGVTLTLNEKYGYIQVQAVISESLNLGLTPVFEKGDQEEYWLSIDPEEGSSGSQEEPIYKNGIGLYWRNFRGVENGEPVYKNNRAQTYMRDEIGQDIKAVFVFWDGETAIEIEPAALTFPEDLSYEICSEYANAVYMEFDKPIKDYITYEAPDGTVYEFALEVKANEEPGVDTVAFFVMPERTEDAWIENELLSGISGSYTTAYLMWNPDLFTLEEKADFKIYLEKNEEPGAELPATVWDDTVDALLKDYGITLTLDAEENLAELYVDFAAVGGTLDFAAVVVSKDGTEYEVQLSIDEIIPTVKMEDYSPALKWRPVEKVDGVYTELIDEPLRSMAQITAMEDLCMALYEVDEDGDETPVSADNKYLRTAGLFDLNSVRGGEEHWVQVVSSGTTHGSVNIATSYGSKMLPWYSDAEDIDEAALNAVELLYALDIMLGNERGQFMPDELVTRAQLAKLIYVILNYGEDDTAVNYRGANIFSDVKDGQWYEGYVNYCAVTKLVQGTDGKFYPNDPVTVAKAAKTILTALGYSAQARDYVGDGWEENALSDAQLVGLLDDMDIDLNGNITRQWLAKMLENMLLKALTIDSISGKYYYVPAGIKYFDLTDDSAEYQTIYRAIPMDTVLPFAAFYTESTRDGDYFADKELFYDLADPQPYYLLVKDGWTITGIDLDAADQGFDMSFFDWETVELADGSTVVEVNFENTFVGGRWYLIEVTAENAEGQVKTYRTNFTVVKDGEGQLVWRWVKRDEKDELYAEEGDEIAASSIPGDDFEMAFFLLEGDTETPVAMEDLEFPDFVSVNLMEKGNPYFFEMLFEDYGDGFIIYNKDGSLYQMPVECPEPALAYYSKPEKNDRYDLNEMLMGFYGETKSAYLMWDPEELGQVEKVTVYFKMSNADAALDGVELEDAAETLAEYDITVTPNLNKGYIQVDTSVGIDKNLELTLHFTDGYKESAWLNIDNELTVIINEWRSGKENPVVEYKGVEYTFGIGRIENSGKFDMFSAGGGFGATSSNKSDNLEETVYLGAMTDFDTGEEAAAPAWVYDYITDVSFEIAGYINTADLTKEESNVYINKVYKTPMAEMEMYTADIRTEQGGFVEALLQVRFTVAFPGQKPVNCLVENVVHFAYNLSISPDLSEVDTADELNQLFSGEEAFMDWIRKQDKENGTTMYDDYRGNFALNWEASFELILPAVTYDDIITVSLDNVEFGIEGSTANDGSRTTMPGMKLLNNNYFFMNGIDFVADKRIKQSYGNETFTCGILSGDEDADFAHCDAYKIHNCTFTGFDYGVRNTQYGYTCVGGDNVFTDCKVGYLIDCAGKRGGNANDSTEGSRFVNCGTAIRIKGLPDYLTPYDYRIYNCDFIGNDMDIDVSQKGRFYFIENYYGDPKHKNEVVDDAKDVHKRPPSVRGRGYADVVVNPRWRDPVTLEGSNHNSNHLIVDTKHGLVNYMFNDDALGWSFDSSTLNTDLSNQAEGISLAMTDDKEETLGTWGIAGGAARTQLLSLFAEETTVADTFCPALDINEDKDGSIHVTIDESELFDLRKVTLTIPCDFIQASVKLNDTPVAATTSGGEVTFTVVQGGTYVISEALDEETIEQSFVTGGAAAEEGETVPEAQVQMGWFDYNAGQPEDDPETKPSFVQIGTETQQEVQQVNPDDENLGTAEDTLVETEVVKVEAIYQAPVAADAEDSVKITVLLVLYDSNGRMVAMQEQSAKQNEGTKVITVECDKNLIGTGAVQVRAFVISANGDMSPLAPVPFSQMLEIPQ